jgi:hypothetical protein
VCACTHTHTRTHTHTHTHTGDSEIVLVDYNACQSAGKSSNDFGEPNSCAGADL